MKKFKELNAYAITDDFKFYLTNVVISHSKEIAIHWLKENSGYLNEEMAKFTVKEFPLDKKVFVRDFGETTAKEMIDEVIQNDTFRKFPIVAFWIEAKNDYYENWHSHFEIENPTD
ncbi:hypothetical protein [Halalkalibacter akibai]|uniref:Uncharacterized protein n=1 Tax=Halalkalibacter akibai (strain ATCC 43226 / DSM 21942 / CIP 109018 / JCM 9157 / 1139) TaxID=1236973 RepID=W4QUB5_HALA3|nr:hypothetical protein [Halalkalibacter akibai]GAE35765.1 hypothetical protein JCM9157_2896 [Halalkalibacter akibai JCM 9157]